MLNASTKQQARNGLLRRTVRKFGGFLSVLLLTLTCDFLSLIAVYTLRLSLLGVVKPTDLLVGLIIPSVLVPLTSMFYIFLIRDLDKVERELDKALEIAAKAQAVARSSAIGTMAAGIAHEINNPLAIIKGRAEIAKSLHSRGLLTPEKFATFHESITRASDRISHIIAGMRTMALVDATVERTNLVELVEQTTQLFRGRALLQAAHLSIEKRISDPALTHVLVNGAHFMQALTSLMSNAFDAIEEQKDSWVRVCIENKGPYARVSVLNSGPVIPPAIRPRLMEPFFSTKPIGKGIGLGLSMSRSMVEGMKGELLLDETQPHTCFVIQLPYTENKSHLLGAVVQLSK